MSILCDHEIEREISITPMAKCEPRIGVISYGLSSYGYDLRVGRDYFVFTNIHTAVVDPKNFDQKSFVHFDNVDFCIIPPNSFALASSLEHISMPEKITAIAVGKSTYARCGIILNVTPIESMWKGHVTLEISNSTPLPCKIYSEEGICQLIFFRGDKYADLDYDAKRGIYQDQVGITLPRIRDNCFPNKKEIIVSPTREG